MFRESNTYYICMLLIFTFEISVTNVMFCNKEMEFQLLILKGREGNENGME